MSEIYEAAKAEFLAVRQQIIQSLADDKITFAELWDALVLLYKAGVTIVEKFPGAGPEKRQAVIDAVMECWREDLKPMDFPYMPDVLVDPAIESVLPKMVGWGVDTLVALYNGQGWPEIPNDAA